MKFITYYYDKDPKKSNFYEQCFVKLKHNLENFNHVLIGDNIDFSKINLDAYDKLNLYKPTFILEKIKQLKEPVIWIDADTTVFAEITEFNDSPCDIGFAIREHDCKTPHAAFIYFSNTSKSIEFLKKWEELCEDKKYKPWDCTEHCLLIDLFNNLDNTYCICEYQNLASINNNTKVKIGISPAGWEYERNKK
jgi:hypothetical protein